MHYAISTKVLSQTHMWYTKNKWSNFLKIFQFLWFLNFLNTLKNRIRKVRSIKTSTKQNLKKKHQQGSVCFEKDKLMQDKEVEHTSHMRFKEFYQHQWPYEAIQTVDHREAWWICPPFDCLCVWIQDIQLYLLPNPKWSGNVSLCVLTLNAKLGS